MNLVCGPCRRGSDQTFMGLLCFAAFVRLTARDVSGERGGSMQYSWLKWAGVMDQERGNRTGRDTAYPGVPGVPLPYPL